MAQKRMFDKSITESDAFRDMPISSQALYFHLGMEADDEGVVNNANSIRRSVGASEDDLKILIMKNFLIPFETGVVVIKHWKLNNSIAKDRFKPSNYREELSMLQTKDNKVYTLCCQSVNKLSTQTSIDKVSIDKDRIDKIRLDKVSIDKTNKSVCSLLNDDEWKQLDNYWNDILSLIDLVDQSCPDLSEIRHPVAYINKVALSNSWPLKGE